MPIRLTWTQPTGVSLGYIIYRKIGTGDINKETDFLANVSSSPLLFDDNTYSRNILQNQGYTYVITAIGVGGEGPLSNSAFSQFVFEEPILNDNWDTNISLSESLEFSEMWELTLTLTPSQLYLEQWEPAFFLESSELWEPTTPIFTLESTEDWESTGVVFTLESTEPWDLPPPVVFTLESTEGWES